MRVDGQCDAGGEMSVLPRGGDARELSGIRNEGQWCALLMGKGGERGPGDLVWRDGERVGFDSGLPRYLQFEG